MNRRLYWQHGCTVCIVQVHIFELHHHGDPIVANFWGNSSLLPFLLDGSPMQKGFPVLLLSHSITCFFFLSPINKRWLQESRPGSGSNPNLWHSLLSLELTSCMPQEEWYLFISELHLTFANPRGSRLHPAGLRRLRVPQWHLGVLRDKKGSHYSPGSPAKEMSLKEEAKCNPVNLFGAQKVILPPATEPPGGRKRNPIIPDRSGAPARSQRCAVPGKFRCC